MVIQHNLSAGNTERQMGIVKGNKAKSTQLPVKWIRINCAADDAAGLSISEKMRKTNTRINTRDSQCRRWYIPMSGCGWCNDRGS